MRERVLRAHNCITTANWNCNSPPMDGQLGSLPAGATSVCNRTDIPLHMQ